MNKQQILELIKDKLSIDFFKKTTYDEKELRVELKLGNEVISYDYVNVETLLK